MKLYLVNNSDMYQWIVCAENEEQAKSLIDPKMLDPLNIAPPWFGMAPNYGKVIVKELTLDEPAILLASIQHKVWM